MCKYHEDSRDAKNEAIQNIADKKARRLEAFIEKHIWFYKYLPKCLLKKLIILEIQDINCQFTLSKKYTLKINRIFWVDIYFDVF